MTSVELRHTNDFMFGTMVRKATKNHRWWLWKLLFDFQVFLQWKFYVISYVHLGRVSVGEKWSSSQPDTLPRCMYDGRVNYLLCQRVLLFHQGTTAQCFTTAVAISPSAFTKRLASCLPVTIMHWGRSLSGKGRRPLDPWRRWQSPHSSLSPSE